MFELHDHLGAPLLMRDGKPFRYSSRGLAKTAKGIFEAAKNCATFYRIREVA
jgi:hypothetical protein